MTAPALRPALPADEVRAELSRILASSEFAASRQLTSFLHYVVEEALAGREDRLKERTLAHGALGRDSTFDPRQDCIVRVVAGKLRRALERYFAIYGAGDPLQIDVPKGSYCPVIRRRSAFRPEDSARPPHEAASRTDVADALQIVAIVAFRSHTCGRAERLAADLLAEDLVVRLSRFRWLELIDSSCVLRGTNGRADDIRALALRLRADFVVAGTVSRMGRGIRLTVRLIDVRSGVMIWADQYEVEIEDGRLAHENDVVNRITTSVCGLFDDARRTDRRPAAVGPNPVSGRKTAGTPRS